MNNKDIKISALDAVQNSKGIIGKKTDIQTPELWEFPMDYPISIIGHEGEHETLHTEVTTLLTAQFSDFDTASIVIKPSKTGRFHSLKCHIKFTNAEQVNTLYASLDDAKTVRMVL